ncbi:MAG: hypothetical protein J0I34_12890 [Pseudonocardia sp.]|uniref:hypothetical protein n=1 Tax=unclassified Pseudonocardia TaxID=2619320 RepID=UPI00086EC7D2|nr:MULTISPECIES: hypothetical protein [unclassified Pseudonocardia]MBN9109671.1 hypothetical protein [Pseudonocardia sp.]ODU17370.1 MAG: hypothetical protein ABS80_20390 [Pseudonocardia sp. SCN 72-51]ODV09099.1 MAG: hypothetical protein ABT15_00255 [Pseudonocardia sp. SCN 73-27]
MVDRYAEATRMRRAELTAQRDALAGYRAEVRTVCGLARASAPTHVTAVVGALTAESVRYVDRACRADRIRFPGHAQVAADRAVGLVLHRVGRRLLPELRRVATARGLPVQIVDTGPPDAAAVTLPALPPPARPWQVLPGSRTVLPWLGMPIVGAPAVSGTVGPAVACGLVLLVATAAARWVAADRARLRQWVPGVAAAVRAAATSVLVAWLMHVEQQVVAALDVAVAARLATIEGELAALAEGENACART